MLKSSFPDTFPGRPLPKALIPNSYIGPIQSGPAIKIRRNGLTTKFIFDDGEILDLPIPRQQAI
jgi:hypothetical protein